ncbi:uncharacterized protein N7511_006882 [Penicillium nucicola]|uniref:uncharacterized protein n=1 Tax=Penicillium nucicola TaxID=1850975 RepID=UPI0025456298|nr:uncharacterized protein N7511_006882 [Penicillium nucicola]KAJ5758188.1 hypothetical protein N7511_006882 [Penicillium nucicola]
MTPTRTRDIQDFLLDAENIRLHVYRGWVNAWLSYDKNLVERNEVPLPLAKLAQLFEEENVAKLLDYKTLRLAVFSFKKCLEEGEILFGGTKPPSCEETNLASAKYNPRSACTCLGLFPIPAGTDLESFAKSTSCGAIQKTLEVLRIVQEKTSEWNNESFYTSNSLEEAVAELLFANAEVDEIAAPQTCRGPEGIPIVQAPDRRPHLVHDTQSSIRQQLYPKSEQVKMCVDAKQYLVIASNASASDDGLIAAIADAGNDILIGDYCEVADDKTLFLLQQTGAAAVAFIKLSHLSGVLSDWHFDNLMSSTLHFRVMGYYRNHAEVPGGIYGSRMTGILAHRYIDLSLFHAVVTASLATGQELDSGVYFCLNEACTLINDLVDFRSDTARKQRENVVLRGVRGNLCAYLDGLIGSCIDLVTDSVTASPVSARVAMAFCNWAVLGSHHKVYELVKETTARDQQHEACEYQSVGNSSKYAALLAALEPYGTLGRSGPSVSKPRVHMDIMYNACASSEKLHLAWLADMTRSLMEPNVMRRIVDVVHFDWSGDIGDINYCP